RSHTVTLALAPAPALLKTSASTDAESWHGELNGTRVRLERDVVRIEGEDGAAWTARLIAPLTAGEETLAFEVVESGAHYLWVRALLPDPAWPRIIEVQLDSLGTAVVQAHVQRLESGDGTAPDLGWLVEGPPVTPETSGSFGEADDMELQVTHGRAMSFPLAALDGRGAIEPHMEAAPAEDSGVQRGVV